MPKVSLVIVSKDEPELLVETLNAAENLRPDLLHEVLVVDASQQRLDRVRVEHPWVVWYDYEQPKGVRVTIAHQRNIGVTRALGDVIVFTDCGTIPRAQWLNSLLAPIFDEDEWITCGPQELQGRTSSGSNLSGHTTAQYVSGAGTGNLAFRRDAFDAVGGFDESFAAGEDMDFTWRLIDSGYRLRWVEDAMLELVEGELGDAHRQMRRAFAYGVGWARLLRKHPRRLQMALRGHSVNVIYPVFLLGMPLTIKYRAYPLLLLVPLWRARHEDAPLLVLLEHFFTGAGVLAEVVGLSRRTHASAS
jgi:cellulose synthase/poly-beta-1,6-N-acetylglucosamine synthase-like glycosyltransferase